MRVTQLNYKKVFVKIHAKIISLSLQVKSTARRSLSARSFPAAAHQDLWPGTEDRGEGEARLDAADARRQDADRRRAAGRRQGAAAAAAAGAAPAVRAAARRRAGVQGPRAGRRAGRGHLGGPRAGPALPRRAARPPGGAATRPRPPQAHLRRLVEVSFVYKE